MAKDETTQHCAFCGQDSDHCRLLSGNGHFICEECVALCYKIMFPEAQYPRVGKDLDAKIENFEDLGADWEFALKPKEIKA